MLLRGRVPPLDRFGILVERFKNLGVCASRAGVTAALAELALELELSGWAPWRLIEMGTGRSSVAMRLQRS